MRQDLIRLVLILIVSAVAGVLTDRFFACLFFGLLAYVAWFSTRLHRLLRHLRDRDSRDNHEYQGSLDEILIAFDRNRQHHLGRSYNMTGFLRRFRTAVMALPDAVVVLGANGEIEWANQRSREYLGVDWPKDNGQRIGNLLRDPQLVSLLQEGQAKSPADRLEHSLSQSGDRVLEFRVIPYGDEQRLLVARDITKIHKANQMRRDFIANASHELRTPLTVIAGYLESIAHETGKIPPDNLAQIIGKIRKHTVRMQRLIDDLLKLSSLESATTDSAGDEIMVSELLSSVFNEAKSLSGEAGHIFYLETSPELWLRGDQKGLYSAFSNLVFNAVQYTPARGVIRVRWYASGDAAVMEVTDSGDGIPAEHIPRLTERFYRVDKGRSRDKGGTGLGLAIVKHVLANHNAQLYIRSEVGKGSTFQCRFPKERLIWKSAADGTSLSA